jgi:hypothetical protein
MIEIVCYMGGTCGDLISAIIDCRDSQLERGRIIHTDIRQRLKKPHQFTTTKDKDDYLKQVETETDYQSISSHDLSYHIESTHSFIGIVCDNFNVALKAAHRFKNFHRPHVWNEMQSAAGAKTVDDYAQMILDFSNLVRQHTTKTVKLESIMSGNVLPELSNILKISFNKSSQNVYKDWMIHTKQI